MILLKRKCAKKLKEWYKTFELVNIQMALKTFSVLKWPFNLDIFYTYLSFYVVFYFIYTKPKRILQNKFINLNKQIFKWSWSFLLNNSHLHDAENFSSYLPNYISYDDKL
jgi:hypothetical protein